jgi:RNA polymerase sigma-70 factor, ECF subfamily
MADKGQRDIDPDRWVDEHGDAMFRFALIRLRDPVLAEEVVQETFLAGLKAKERFSGRSSERTWLIGILKHKIIDQFRKRSRERPGSETDAATSADQAERESGEEAGPWQNGPADWETDPEEVTERSELREVLTNCVSDLPSRLGNAYSLRELDGLETKEICKALDITETNLWVMLHRARTRLKSCLETNWTAEDDLIDS